MTKRIPKLRRLLREMDACIPARRWTRNMTLSEAWPAVQEHDLTAPWQWVPWFMNRSGLRFFSCPCSFCKENHKIRLKLSGVKKPIQRWDENTIPDKLPAAMLRKWDGYESVKRSKKPTTKGRN